MSITYKEKLSNVKQQNYIPKEIYVSFQSRGSDELVGFMIPHVEGDDGHTKRKDSCDKWGSALIPPRTFKNTLRNGFAMIKQVRRYESDAVYWRVLHPEGFEFEIGLDNFEYIMENHVLDQGAIVDADHTKPANFTLVLQRSNRKWIMVDEQHPEYIKSKDNIEPGSAEFKALEQQVKDESKTIAAEVQIGDVVQRGVWSNDEVYLGVMSIGYKSYDSSGKSIIEYIRKKVFRQLKTKQTVYNYNTSQHENVADKLVYDFASSGTKITKVVTKTKTPLTIEQAVQEVNDAIANAYTVENVTANPSIEIEYNHAKALGAWVNKPKKKVELVRTPIDIIEYLEARDTNSLMYMIGKTNRMCLELDTGKMLYIDNIEQHRQHTGHYTYGRNNTQRGYKFYTGSNESMSIIYMQYQYHDNNIKVDQTYYGQRYLKLENEISRKGNKAENYDRFNEYKAAYDKELVELEAKQPSGWITNIKHAYMLHVE